MADNLAIVDGNNVQRNLATKDNGGVHTTIHLEDAAQRAALIAQLAAVATAVNTLAPYLDGVEGLLTTGNGKQDTLAASTALIGTRAYGAGLNALNVSAVSAQSDAVNATEVTLHASAKMFVRVGAAATLNDIPLEAGEKFTLRINSGQRIHAITPAGTGTLNIIPVA